MNNSRFAISLHILTLLDKFPDTLLSSDYMAGSINIHPVLVRAETGNLRKKGLVSSKRGKAGGFYLKRPANEILLSEVYRAAQQSPLLGQNKNIPNSECEVGKQINQHLEDLSNRAEEALIMELSQITLSDFCKRFE